MGSHLTALLRAARVGGSKIKPDREDQGCRPCVDGTEEQRFMASDVVRDQPDDEPDNRHSLVIPTSIVRLKTLDLTLELVLSDRFADVDVPGIHHEPDPPAKRYKERPRPPAM